MNLEVQKQFNLSKFELFVTFGVISLYSFLVFSWANFRGAIGVPRNDDWVYLHMAQWFAESGQFRIESGSLANAVGLVILGQPTISIFGFSIANLQLLEILVGAIGLFATWLLLRTFLNIWMSFISIGTLLASPFWISTSVSFMTDVPAYTFQMVALLLAVRANLDQKFGLRWLAAAYFFSFAAFSVREYSIASGLAIAGFFFFSKSIAARKLRSKTVTIALFWMLACIALYIWRSSLVNAAELRGMLDVGAFKESTIQAVRALAMLGFLLIPALALSNPFSKLKLLSLQKKILSFALSTIFLAVMILIFRQRGLIFGNYFAPQGSYIETFPLGVAPNLIPLPLFDSLTWLGVIALAYVLWIFSLQFLTRIDLEASIANKPRIENANQQVGLVTWYCSVMLGTLIFIPLITNAPRFDRYFLPIVPLITSLVIYFIFKYRLSWAPGKILSGFFLAGLAFVSSIFIDSSFIVDGLKWKAGSQLVSDGYSPETIDAGYEWFGYHQDEVATGQNIKPIRNWWITLYDSPNVCASIGIGALDSGVREASISHSFEVSNFLGTNLVVWSVGTEPSCIKK
jgi:hypothetical protein